MVSGYGPVPPFPRLFKVMEGLIIERSDALHATQRGFKNKHYSSDDYE